MWIENRATGIVAFHFMKPRLKRGNFLKAVYAISVPSGVEGFKVFPVTGCCVSGSAELCVSNRRLLTRHAGVFVSPRATFRRVPCKNMHVPSRFVHRVWKANQTSTNKIGCIDVFHCFGIPPGWGFKTFFMK